MTSNIPQHITPRGRGTRRVSQRGAIDHSTAAVMFGLSAVLIVGMLAFFYLQQVVYTASQGTGIHELEEQMSSLREKEHQLELEGANLRSLTNIEEETQKLNLVPTESVSYLVPGTDHVALLTK